LLVVVVVVRQQLGATLTLAVAAVQVDLERLRVLALVHHSL
jgi:hypothetical protein